MRAQEGFQEEQRRAEQAWERERLGMVEHHANRMREETTKWGQEVLRLQETISQLKKDIRLAAGELEQAREAHAAATRHAEERAKSGGWYS